MEEYHIDRKQYDYSLVYCGEKNRMDTIYLKFIDLMFTKKQHQFQYYRIPRNDKYKKRSVYLYRKEDDTTLMVDTFPSIR